MDILNQLRETGVGLGYSGKELQQFVADQQNFIREREREAALKEKEETEHRRQLELLI